MTPQDGRHSQLEMSIQLLHMHEDFLTGQVQYMDRPFYKGSIKRQRWLRLPPILYSGFDRAQDQYGYMSILQLSRMESSVPMFLDVYVVRRATIVDIASSSRGRRTTAS